MNGKTAECIKGNISRTKNMALEYIFTQMAVDLRDNGEMANKME